MDDANLKILAVNQPGLKPDFSKDITNYDIVVAFNVEKLNIKATCSDNGASFSIKSDTGYGEDVKLNEGENKITIEVTSEDGTTKKYLINCKKLSASDAKLKSLEFKGVDLIEKFEPTVYEYNSIVDFKTTDAKFKTDLFDPGCTIESTCNKSVINKNEESFYCFTLNYGYTEIVVKVTSPNKSNSQNYTIKLIRNPFPRLASFSNLKDKIELEDSISLAPIYCAFKLNESDQNVYSYPFINFLQKISSPDQLNSISLSLENSKSQLHPQISLENKLADTLIRVPYLNGEFSKDIQLKHVSQLIDEISSSDKFKINEEEFKNFNPPINKIPENLPSYQQKPWEKYLQIIYDETDADKLLKYSNTHFEKYISLISTGKFSLKTVKKDSNDSPLYFLNMSLFNLATSLKHKNRNYETHFRLAMLLEEKELFESIYGKEKEEEDTVKSTDLKTQNKMAADSSKEEEIDAICKARNVPASAPDAEKLKAIDQEYHYLIETHQNAKAEQVQLLYLFKAKKANIGSKGNLKITEIGNYLVQANLKYLDGMSLVIESKTTNFLACFIVGRSLCQIGDYTQALIYLKNCINWSDLQLQSLARFYFGFALSKEPEIVAANPKLVVYYISFGLQYFLNNLSTCLSNRKILFSEDYFSIFNTIFMEAFLVIGKLAQKAKFPCISPEDAFKYCGWLCSIALNEINNRTIMNRDIIKNSRLIKDLIRILIEAHTCLANLEYKIEPDQLNTYRSLQSKRCVNLINLIRSTTDRDHEEILRLQEKICQRLVFFDPLDSYHLLLLGNSKLELYDYLVDCNFQDEAYLSVLLEQCKNSLVACNEYENDKNTDNLSSSITEQKWWVDEQKRLAEQEEAAKKNERVPSAAKDAKAPANQTSKPAAPAKGATAAKNAPAKPAAAPVAAKKPAPAPANAKAANTNTKNGPQCKSDPKQATQPAPQETKPVEAPKEAEAKTEVDASAKLNQKYLRKKNVNFNKNILYIQIQLNSARVYSRLKEYDKAKSFYEKVIKKEPNKQDAYIELANMLRKNGDMAGAIDVYASFPVNEKIQEKDLKDKENADEGFDDAFIYGELVTLLINSQKYDDPRLVKYLILWAKIMGIGIAEKYIGILDKANKTKACKEIYAGVHKKSVDDPDLVQFFKFKGWH